MFKSYTTIFLYVLWIVSGIILIVLIEVTFLILIILLIHSIGAISLGISNEKDKH
jgi:hypothetical protein